MHIKSTSKADSKHTRYEFSHKVKGTKITFEIVAMNEERGREKAWDYVRTLYRALSYIQHPTPDIVAHAIKAVNDSNKTQHA